jgi:hypothetical protein
LRYASTSSARTFSDIVEIASDELLARKLAFRGGTCLHKLHLPEPVRYSEDLEYTRIRGLCALSRGVYSSSRGAGASLPTTFRALRLAGSSLI